MIRPFTASRPTLLATAFVALTTLAACVDAPSAPDEATFAPPFLIAPSLALVGPGGAPVQSESQADALNEAFDLVDRFRMVVTRVSTGEVVVNQVITVTPGQDEYDLSVSIDVANPEEQFSVTLTAYQGTTELFTSAPVTVTAVPETQSSSVNPPPATSVTMEYSGPGATATAVQISPASLVLGPGGSGSFSAAVQDANGNALTGVPVSWTVSAGGVVSVENGAATAEGEGAVQVVVATPTGLEARAWAYVVGGELAYAQGGEVRVRGPAGGDAVSRSGAGGAGQPAWSPDGGRLYYAAGGKVRLAGGGTLMDGSWPSVSPDGSKLAVDAGGTVTFANADGSNPTPGPSGGTPVWSTGATVLVSGGSVQEVRADGTGRTTVAGGNASLPALGPGGEVAYVADGQLRVVGREGAILDGAGGRPSWSPNGLWLVVAAGGALTVVPSDGSAPGARLPGLAGATNPAFRTNTPLTAVGSVSITGLDPDPPIPGEPVRILGSGFDWIIPTNNTVLWPSQDGSVATEVRVVRENAIETVMPRAVVEGQIRVETRGGTGLLAFNPQLATIDVLTATSFGDPVSGVGVVVTDGNGDEVLRGTTDEEGRTLLTGLQPGDYQVALAPPQGFRVEGDATHSLTLSTGTEVLEVEILPLVKLVTTDPERLEVEVGGRIEIQLIPVDFRGATMERVKTIRWLSGGAHLTAIGDGLTGALTGLTPSAGPGEATLVVQLNGDVFEVPVSVTSYIEGTVTQDPAPATTSEPAPAPSTTQSAPETIEEASEPAPGTTVKVLVDDEVVGTGITDSQGRYKVPGLFAGTYDVTIDLMPELTPQPASQTVTLDGAHPTGRADFHLSREPVSFIILSADPAEIDALDGTTNVTVAAFDENENRLGRRAATFTSLNPGIASVDANGVVTGLDNGVATIEVTVEDVTSTIDITVDQKAVKLTLLDEEEPKPLEEEHRTFVGEGGTLDWEAFDANDHEITHKVPTFTSSDAAVASVDIGGVVDVLQIGTTDLTAEMDGAIDVLKLFVLGATAGDLTISHIPGPGVMTPAEVSAALIGKVNGTLWIDDTGLTDLAGLEVLLEVTGDVKVLDNGSLTDISGLGGLEYVHGTVYIINNDQLLTPSSPAQLAKLIAVEGSITVVDNDQITNMNVFGNLEHVDGLVFIDNPMLTDLDGLSALDHMDNSLYLENNPNLNSTNNLPNLEVILGDLVIEAGAQVFGLPALTALGGGMQVGGGEAYGNEIVEQIHFPSLVCTSYGIEIYENLALTHATFPALEFVDYSCTGEELALSAADLIDRSDFIFLDDDPEFRPDPSDIGKPMEARLEAARQRAVSSHAEVERLRGEGRTAHRTRKLEDERSSEARRAESRQGSLERRNTQDQQRVAAAEGIPVAAQSAVQRNAREVRPERSRLQKPARIEGPLAEYPTGGGFSAWNSPVLTTVDLSSLTWVMGTIDFYDVALTALTLPSLEYTGDSFFLGDMPDLLSFAVPLLEEVGYTLEIYNNEFLSSLSAPALTDVGDDLYVSYNDALGAFMLPQLQYVGWDLEFYDNTGLTSVNLPVLNTVEDDVYFGYNSGLVDITMATASILNLGWDFEIYENPDLQTVHVPGLAYVYDDLEIYYNDALVSVVLASAANLVVDYAIWVYGNAVPHAWALTIPGLVHAEDGVYVEDNTGLESVTVASGDPATVEYIYFYNNLGLVSISFPNVHSVFNGDFYVQENPDLQTLSAPMLESIEYDLYLDNLGTAGTALTLAFDALVSIGNYMYVQYSPGLESFTLPSLQWVQYGAEVTWNERLTSFGLPALTHMTMPPPAVEPMGPLATAGLPAISSAADLHVENNGNLTSFDLSALEEVDQLFVDSNESLVTLGSLGPMSSGTRVYITNNGSLTSAAGLSGVTDLHTLRFDNNPSLTDFAGLGSLENVVYFQIWSDGGAGSLTLPALERAWWNFEVLNNPDLVSVSAPNLTQVGDGNGPQNGPGNLYLNGNGQLATATFTSLATIDAQIQIGGSALTTLSGLAALTSPVYLVSVVNNPSLADVSGLSGIGTTNANPAVASSFAITNNTALPDCEVYSTVVDVIEARNPGSAFGGTVTVSNSACTRQD